MALLWYNIGVGLISKLRCLTTSRNVGNNLSEPIECLMAALSEARRTKIFGSGRLASAIIEEPFEYSHSVDVPPMTVKDVEDFCKIIHRPKCMMTCSFCGEEMLNASVVSGMLLCDDCIYLQWKWLNLVWRKLGGVLGLREKYLKAEADMFARLNVDF